MEKSTAVKRVENIRYKLREKDAFHAVILWSLDIVETTQCPYAATDGKRLFINPEHWSDPNVSIAEHIGLLAEESEHIRRAHHIRLPNADPRLKNMAADCAIFHDLLNDGYYIPEHILAQYPNFEQYAGLSMEQIYILMQNEENNESDNEDTSDEPQPNGNGDISESESGSESDDSNSDETGDAAKDDSDGQDAGDNGAGDDSDNDNATGDDSGDGNGDGDDDGEPDGNGDSTGDEDTSETSDGTGDGEPDGTSDAELANELRNASGGSRGAILDSHFDATEVSEAELSNELAEHAIQMQEFALLAESMGNGVSAAANRAITDAYDPQHDWREELREYFAEAFQEIDDYTMQFPDPATRHLGLYLPDVTYRSGAEIGAFIDCSGSVTQAMLNVFAAELTGIMDEYQPERLHVIYFDGQAYGPETFERGEEIVLTLRGGGSTNLMPVWEMIDRERLTFVAAVCLTDLYIWDIDDLPEPDFDVIWASIGKQSAPFGSVVKIDARMF